MSIYGIFTSRSQKRLFLLTLALIILLFATFTGLIYHFMPDTRGWNLVINVFVALLSSAIFAITAILYVKYFFVNPYEASFANKLLPRDIGPALVKMAESASEYKLFVRTGRHFRAEVLPNLITNAKIHRRQVTIEAILLDFRNDQICSKYASYRQSSSFDRNNWTKTYVQKEVLATILKLIQASHAHSTLIKFNLYLSSRLSNFRFDGSQDQIIITREDPKDIASRYRVFDNDFSAYLNEFNWARDEAFRVEQNSVNDTPTNTLKEMFDNCPIVAKLETDAADATDNPSPYPR